MFKKIIKIFKKDNTEISINFKGLNLPPFRTNQGLEDNETYLKSGVEQLQFLLKMDLIHDNTTFLDFGCGQGRIVNSFKYSNIRIKKYIGIDTDSNSIKWCNKYLSPYHDKYNFIHLPSFNARYNRTVGGLQKLPFNEYDFDLIFLNSVFSHMLEDDIKFYLDEFNRILKINGVIFLTAFIEENVPNVEENPINFISKSKGSLHRVRYEKEFFFELIRKSNLKVDEFYHQKINRTKQSVVIASKKY